MTQRSRRTRPAFLALVASLAGGCTTDSGPVAPEVESEPAASLLAPTDAALAAAAVQENGAAAVIW